ncbi:MAG: KH domain-containing protein [Bacilli bacterium]|nr:KH domain-containing protein [Bacilli bacterium]
MSILELTEFLVKSIVSDSESVSIKQYDDEDYITIEILVNSDEMGKVIGKGGNTINAIRTIVQASAYLNKLKKVKINVEAF